MCAEMVVDVGTGPKHLCLRKPKALNEAAMDTTTLIIIVIIILMLGGGFYGRGRWY
jgi:hypothetical protein